MTFDDPLITYDGTPTEAFFVQLLAKVEGGTGPSAAEIAAAVAALITPLTLQQFIALK